MKAVHLKTTIGLVIFLIGLTTATHARAQQFLVTPSTGVSGEGNLALAIAGGRRFHFVHPEAELAWAHGGLDRRVDTPKPFGEDVSTGAAPHYLPAAVADVSTLIFKLAVPVRVYRYLEPYGVVGAGIARATRQPPPEAGAPLPTSSKVGTLRSHGSGIRTHDEPRCERS